MQSNWDCFRVFRDLFLNWSHIMLKMAQTEHITQQPASLQTARPRPHPLFLSSCTIQAWTLPKMTHLINHKPPLQHTWGLFPLILHHFDVLCARLNESWMQGDDKLTSFRESRSYILKEEWNTESRAEFISSTWILKNTWKSDVSWVLALKSKAV